MRALFPLDGSEEGFAALEKGLGLLPGAEVTLFAVAQKGFEQAGEDRVAEFDEDEADEIFPTRDACDRMLDRAEKMCKEAGVTPARKTVEGKVQKMILAEAGGHDVLVMHGLERSGFKEKLRLSNTEGIARKAPCNVLLVRT